MSYTLKCKIHNVRVQQHDHRYINPNNLRKVQSPCLQHTTQFNYENEYFRLLPIIDITILVITVINVNTYIFIY